MINYLYMIICISYKNMFTIYLKLISIAPLYTLVIGATGSINHYTTNSTGLKWSNNVE